MAGQRTQILTYAMGEGWVQSGKDIPTQFIDGDRFRVSVDTAGKVEVYRNGELLAKQKLVAVNQSFQESSIKFVSYRESEASELLQQTSSAVRIAYWKLEESGSPWSDSSGRGHTLSQVAGSVTSIMGKVENGLNNTSNSTDLQAASHTDFNFTRSEGFSIETWARTSNTDDTYWHMLFGKRGPAGGTIIRAGHWGDSMIFTVRTSTGQNKGLWYTTPRPVNDGQWHHWVFFLDQTNIGYWMDGELVFSEPHGLTSGDFSASVPFDVMNDTHEVNRWFGDVDEFAVYRGVLSEAEILDHYNNGVGKHYDELPSTPTPAPTQTFPATATVTNTPFDTATFTLTVPPTEMMTEIPTGIPAFTDTPVLPTATLPPVPSGPLTIDYTYDALNRLTSAIYSDGRSFGYTYDAAGNVLELEKNLGPGTVVTTYTYDIANQLETAIENGVNWQYHYDANGSLITDGVKTYTYDSANRLTQVSDPSGTVSMDYNGLGQRLSMDAAGVIAHYVMDGDQPLTATSGENTTLYLYGLGGIAEKTDAWSYSLPDGTNTPRQLADQSGGITLSTRYTPWGDALDTYGHGNFTFGYFGGVMDAATGLLYVGNGQYYDPATGRFLTRDAKPNNSNPYVPWDPTGAIIGPLAAMALFFGKRRKRSKWDSMIILLVLSLSVGLSVAACQTTVDGNNVTVTPIPAQPNTYTVTVAPTTVPSSTPTPTGTPIPTITATCTVTPTPAGTPTTIPTSLSTDLATVQYLLEKYGVQLLNGSDNPDNIWDTRRAGNVRRAIEDVANRISKATGKDVYTAFRSVYYTYDENLVIKKVTNFTYNGVSYTGGGVTNSPHLIQLAWIDYVRDDSMRNNIVHELGHAFNQGRGGELASSVPAVYFLNRGAFLHDNSTVMWQANQSSNQSETFADMFLAYTYGVWRDPIDVDTLRKAAPDNPEYWDPSKWMDDTMRLWLK